MNIDEIEVLHKAHETSTIPCCLCGGEVVEFTVPNDIWNLVIRTDGKETDKEYLCLDCWYKALRSKLDKLSRRERAAKGDLELAESCITCIHDWDCEYSNSNGCSIANYKWRGVEAGKGEAE